MHTRSKPQRTVANLPHLKVSTMRTHHNRSARRFEHSAVDNRARSTQFGASRTAAARPGPNTAPKPPLQYGNRNEDRPGLNCNVSTTRTHQNSLERPFECPTTVNRQCDRTSLEGAAFAAGSSVNRHAQKVRAICWLQLRPREYPDLNDNNHA